jgi:3-oxoacyl-[acyl-carrier-protein] synthase III
LFGDGAAAAVLCQDASRDNAIPVCDVVHGSRGELADLLRVDRRSAGDITVEMRGAALASHAIQTMGEAVSDLTRAHGLALTDLTGIVAHGGNGRMPALLARQLKLSPERFWSTTPFTGNLGSVSLPAAWAAHGPVRGPIVWVSVGAGLTWASALTGTRSM